MVGAHAVFRDIDGRYHLDAVRQGVAERDGGIGLGLARVIHYHIEIATIHLINMILREKGPFCGVEAQVCAPIINGIARLERHSRELLVAGCHRQQQKRHYQQRPGFHQSNSGNWKSLLLLLPLIRM